MPDNQAFLNDLSTGKYAFFNLPPGIPALFQGKGQVIALPKTRQFTEYMKGNFTKIYQIITFKYLINNTIKTPRMVAARKTLTHYKPQTFIAPLPASNTFIRFVFISKILYFC